MEWLVTGEWMLRIIPIAIVLVLLTFLLYAVSTLRIRRFKRFPLLRVAAKDGTYSPLSVLVRAVEKVIHKRFWCDSKQRVVDVDFMPVNRNEYDVTACTAFAEDQTISCDKHCVKAVEEDTSQAVGKGSAPNQGSAPKPAFPGNGR